MIKYQCKDNINKCAAYVIALLLRLAKNRGTDAQPFEKVNKVLISTTCTVFNSEIVVYKQVNALSLDVSNLLIKAREEYSTLVTNKTWKKNAHQKSTQHRGKRRKQQPTNIVGLVTSTSQDNEISKLKLELKTR